MNSQDQQIQKSIEDFLEKEGLTTGNTVTAATIRTAIAKLIVENNKQLEKKIEASFRALNR